MRSTQSLDLVVEGGGVAVTLQQAAETSTSSRSNTAGGGGTVASLRALAALAALVLRPSVMGSGAAPLGSGGLMIAIRDWIGHGSQRGASSLGNGQFLHQTTHCWTHC